MTDTNMHVASEPANEATTDRVEWSLLNMDSDLGPDTHYSAITLFPTSLESSVPLPSMPLCRHVKDPSTAATGIANSIEPGPSSPAGVLGGASPSSLQGSGTMHTEGRVNTERLEKMVTGALGNLGAAGRGVQEEELPSFAGESDRAPLSVEQLQSLGLPPLPRAPLGFKHHPQSERPKPLSGAVKAIYGSHVAGWMEGHCGEGPLREQEGSREAVQSAVDYLLHEEVQDS